MGHTETKDGIPNTNSRFYAACILESLAHLHARRITYRDLKPENILIDAMGYAILVDLGFAKIVTDQVSLFKRIVQVKYAFPPGKVVNEVAQDLIQRLIVRRQSNRFGCLARADMDIRDHAWFGAISTEKLLKKEIPAVWIPQIKDALDASHFDSYKQLENEVPSNKPGLSPGQQDLFRDF